MFKSNQTSWGAVDMLASDKYEKLCPPKLVDPNFEKLGDLARYNHQDGKCVQLKMPKSIACWFFSQLFLKVKAMFFFPGQISGEELQLFSVDLFVQIRKSGGKSPKVFEPLKSSKVAN